MRIHQLPSALANQIAAGEVIERPASVVKELLENAFDAQASLISIDIGYGGLNQIKISDNGIGIVADDLPLAIAAHATSKITQLQDLYSIASLGFRGEALASIASISRLFISSKPANQPHAMSLSTAGGEAIHLAPCARNQGTTMDVRDIFFNAPVRKKFLKSERMEFQAIETIVRRFALSAPEIAISLSHNGKQQFHLPPANCDKTQLARIRKLLGKTFIDQARYFNTEHAGLHLYGWISTADYQRSQNDKQWIYVNKRMVKDKLLNHAIKKAYEDLLHPGRYPACLLYLTINPEEVDVNVHPTKHEVRFQQPRLVHDFISSQIQQALHKPSLQWNYSQETLPEVSQLQVAEPYSPPAFMKKMVNDLPEKKNWIAINASFVLIFLQEQPYLIDIIALQRHWLLSILAGQELPLASRPLLVPVSYSIKKSYLEQINEYRQALSQVGIGFDLASEQTLLIRSLPLVIPNLDLKQFLSSVFESPPPSTKELFELLTLCQSFDAQCAREEEIGTLSDYLRALGSDKLNIWCKHLSKETCRGLLNA
ncbi:MULTISPECIES: DNA mismatch repair endonuclease MutL [Legionella]|uniref:DNA mismatch repair protein MutL n=1 Tax=Legionella drozanskii LLAP-1 TaxID=1212489 RepID=A0A0W0SVS8_9GAMM|nr:MULTISPECIES: DNA mismatch repair endonuclease MutL [Legionella]KTC87388.1 DNA mismatch repair protein MutL [Legionella drozanskii LLAP-1]PJE08525.1 MAG: DNA mismatch repair protein MutL [Legionella sp.]